MAEHRLSYPTRAEIPERYRWDLTLLYPDDNAWEVAAATLPPLLDLVSASQGRLGSSPESLLSLLRHHEQAGRLVDRLWQYAARHRDEDMCDNRYGALFDRSNRFRADAAEASAFIRPELHAIEPGTLDRFVSEEPDLVAYSHYFENLLRDRPHTLSSAEEELLAAVGDLSTSPRTIHSMLSNADLRFGEITDEQGYAVELTTAGYERYVRSSDTRVRRDAFNGFFEVYHAHRNSLAATFAANVKQNVFFARSRRHPSALAAALHPDDVPAEVYTSLIASVRAHLPLLHRYFDLRKRILHLDVLHPYDLNAPLAPEPTAQIRYDQAVGTVLEALAPLGEDYVREARSGFSARWVDVYETPNKRVGAHSAGCYASPPYLMLNYLDTLQGTYTLAHELGHSMHSVYSSRGQPYHYAYCSDFIAEVPSVLNEVMMTHHLLRTSTDPAWHAAAINMQLSTMRYSLFRQTMLAEFEMLAHGAVEQGHALTADWLCGTYLRLYAEYHGPNVDPGDRVEIEWAYLPHLYFPFYVCLYAVGMAAATALADRIIREGEPAAAEYRRFLTRGSSAYPLDLLRDAGVDMSSPEPVTRAMSVFEQRLNDLDALLRR